ncbi:MAG: DUF58 domain-containing protein [Thermodesulfobacteriota bacterium]|nr:DUF58 domain-containing protein [Thermodesulfobacteriota bacterium]
MKRFFNKRTFLIFLAIIFFLIAWNREINLLYAMFALLASTLILSHLLPRYSLKGITAERQIASTAFEGDEMDVRVTLRNNHWNSRYMIEVVDSIPAAEPGHQYPMSFVVRLKGRKKREYSFKMNCYKRGEYTVGPLALRSAYPLGISSSTKNIPETHLPLLVYPEMFEIPHLPLRAKGHTPMLGVELISKAGGSEEFLGVREYKQGDSLRYIHWPSTAKHSRYIVKEFEIRASTEVTVLLDLHKGSNIGEGKETTLEYAVKIAASISKYVLERGHSLQLIGYGERPHIIPYAKGLSQLARILEELARVKCDGEIFYSRALPHSSDFLRDGGTAVLLFSHINKNIEDYLYSLSLLRAKRMRFISVFIHPGSFSSSRTDPSPSEMAPLVQELVSEGHPVYFVSKGDDLQRVFAE